MHRLRTEIEIQAPADRVWSILVDFAAYPEWNPLIRSAAGVAAPGERLAVRIHPEGMRGMTLKPVVLRADPGRELRWRGRLLVPGLFDGEHRFELTPLESGGTRFVQEEFFTGILVPVMKPKLDTEVQRGFLAMNRAIRDRAETRTPKTGAMEKAR